MCFVTEKLCVANFFEWKIINPYKGFIGDFRSIIILESWEDCIKKLITYRLSCKLPETFSYAWRRACVQIERKRQRVKRLKISEIDLCCCCCWLLLFESMTTKNQSTNNNKSWKELKLNDLIGFHLYSIFCGAKGAI